MTLRALHTQRRIGQHLEPGYRDGNAARFTNAVLTRVQSLQGILGLAKEILGIGVHREILLVLEDHGASLSTCGIRAPFGSRLGQASILPLQLVFFEQRPQTGSFFLENRPKLIKGRLG